MKLMYILPTQNIPVVVCWNGIRDPGRVSVCVNDANGGNVVQSTLVEQYIVLQRVQADDQLRPEHWAVVQLLVEAGNLLVPLVHDLGPASAEDLLAVGDASGNPLLKQVVLARELGSADNSGVLAFACAYEENEAAASRDFLHNLGGSAEMGCGGFKRNDVRALANTVDVAGIGGVPEGSGMALVGFGCKQELKRDIGGARGIAEERVRLVVGGDLRAQVACCLLCAVLALQ